MSGDADIDTRELANRDAVVAELAVLRALVRGEATQQLEAALDAARERLSGPSSLDQITDGFGLSGFERSVLLLAAGPELVAAVAAELSDHTGARLLTFGGALALLPDAHWSAVTPMAPLRRWELVRLADPASPTHSPLLVDERILHHLAGAGHLDTRLAAGTRPLVSEGALPGPLGQSAEEVAAAWRRHRVAVVTGVQPANVRAVVAAAADCLGLAPLAMPAAHLPADPVDRESALRRMERETVLSGAVWFVECDDAGPGELNGALTALVRLDAPAAVACRSIEVALPPEAIAVDVPRLSLPWRRTVLSQALAEAGCDVAEQRTAEAAGVFDLSLADVRQVALDVAGGAALWPACRARAQVALGALAQILPPRAGWDDLVLPPAQREQLRGLVAAVRHRAKVLDEWGFADRTTRGLGSTALFAGPSGTGKTLAAEVIARELQLDLVVVDLSQVVSKYIGETEKHLRRVFDAAEDGGCVLLFDEADTLFGKRSQVRDSHDRYANLEVGYLLQRMESFRGLAILTTNAREALDPAFTRRLRTIVVFPYPDRELRESLWDRAFPEATPVSGLNRAQLAELDLPGGGIAATALTAAYLAASDNISVASEGVITAANWEMSKWGRAAHLRTAGAGNCARPG